MVGGTYYSDPQKRVHRGAKIHILVDAGSVERSPMSKTTTSQEGVLTAKERAPSWQLITLRTLAGTIGACAIPVLLHGGAN